MKSMILCEGSTDYVLIQYFMRKVYSWQDNRTGEKPSGKCLKRIRTLTKDENTLSIGSCGGVSGLLPGFEYIMEYNSLSSEPEAYERIVILTDRDEAGTEEAFLSGAGKILRNAGVKQTSDLCNDKWVKCIYKNGHGKVCVFQLLILIIPFEETGAMETFLLDAIAENDEYDAGIIRDCKAFVEQTDPEKRYLSKRRYVTKAKFDVYFSVRTAAEQFIERQNILKNVAWEKYAALHKQFEKLGDLTN